MFLSRTDKILMNWIFYFILSITISFFLSAMPEVARAEVYRLSSRYNLRSSPEFTSKPTDPSNNIVGGLKAGSQIEVLESKKLKPSGKLAYRVRVMDGRYKNQTLWIRKSADEHFHQTEAATTCAGDCGEKAMPLNQNNERNLADLKGVSNHFEKEFESSDIDHDKATPFESSKIDEDKTKSADQSLLQKIKNYSESTAVAKMIQAGKRKGAKSFGRCYRGAKQILAAGKLTPLFKGREPARAAKEELTKYGFINLLEVEPYGSQITKASEAPKGAVLVYSSGIPCRNSTVKDCGHIEVKLGEPGEPGYASDYKSNDAINETSASKRFGSRYKLIAVMVKPMEKE